MNRDKLIEAIRLSIARVLDFKVNEKELELLADHLIANGIGVEDEARIYALQMANGKIDMTVGGSAFQNLINMLYQTFKQNGGKNFFTTSFGFDRDSDHYEMTIQKINGQGTAEKLSELKHRADVAEEALRELIAEMYENGIRPICNQEMLYETRLEQAEARLKEKKCINEKRIPLADISEKGDYTTMGFIYINKKMGGTRE